MGVRIAVHPLLVHSPSECFPFPILLHSRLGESVSRRLTDGRTKEVPNGLQCNGGWENEGNNGKWCLRGKIRLEKCEGRKERKKEGAPAKVGDMGTDPDLWI